MIKKWDILAPYRAWYKVGEVSAESSEQALELAGVFEVDIHPPDGAEPYDLPELMPEPVEVEEAPDAKATSPRPLSEAEREHLAQLAEHILPPIHDEVEEAEGGPMNLIIAEVEGDDFHPRGRCRRLHN